jgi:hypothetical protein
MLCKESSVYFRLNQFMSCYSRLSQVKPAYVTLGEVRLCSAILRQFMPG